MITTQNTTTTDILAEMIRPADPTFQVEFAKHVLTWKLNSETVTQVRDLLWRNNAGTISSDEKETLQKYLLVGQFVDLLQAKARESLQHSASAP